MATLRDQQQVDMMNQFSRGSPGGASGAVVKRIKQGLADAEQILIDDLLT